MNNWQAVIIALGIVFGGVAVGISQQQAPQLVVGCVSVGSNPSLTPSTMQQVALQCDEHGRLKVNTTEP